MCRRPGVFQRPRATSGSHRCQIGYGNASQSRSNGVLPLQKGTGQDPGLPALPRGFGSPRTPAVPCSAQHKPARETKGPAQVRAGPSTRGSTGSCLHRQHLLSWEASSCCSQFCTDQRLPIPQTSVPGASLSPAGICNLEAGLLVTSGHCWARPKQPHLQLDYKLNAGADSLHSAATFRIPFPGQSRRAPGKGEERCFDLFFLLFSCPVNSAPVSSTPRSLSAPSSAAHKSGDRFPHRAVASTEFDGHRLYGTVLLADSAAAHIGMA